MEPRGASVFKRSFNVQMTSRDGTRIRYEQPARTGRVFVAIDFTGNLFIDLSVLLSRDSFAEFRPCAKQEVSRGKKTMKLGGIFSNFARVCVCVYFRKDIRVATCKWLLTLINI